MSKQLLFLSIVCLAVCTACASPGKDAARDTVTRFIEGLYTQDAEAVSRTAPFFDELDAAQKQSLYENIRGYEAWDVEAVQIKGSNAIVIVEFSNPEKQIQIQFPLHAQDDSWVIRERISFSTTIDVIPAE